MAELLGAILVLGVFALFMYLVLKADKEKSMRDNNIYYTRAMWSANIGTLMNAQMEIRRKQYESGGIADQHGVDSPAMKMYEDLFEQYDEEIKEMNRRLSLPGLEGL
ncbi:hypothetical protein CHUUTOTORO_01460 [Serratia phage vB_SmaM-ChuuTotoro]|nr:hypothetical protein CHUUTOTORO_01460 [Serratia phage vB_SmaM-ChuuTotoro]